MAEVQESIDVQVPVTTAYNQWTQFEDFPQFMEGVERIEQLDDTRLRWVAKIAGREREWEAKITEQEPDMRIAWAAIGDVGHSGVVTFHRLDDSSCRITLQIEYEPETFADKAGDALGIVQRRVQGDLDRFREFIESRGTETGAWRGTVERPDRG